MMIIVFLFSSRRRHTRCALVTGVQTCALPICIQLARDFVEKQFVERGMVADMNVHWDMGKDGQPKPHAHVMLSMREVGPEGFGQKVREWNSTALLQEWRVAWADHVNER